MAQRKFTSRYEVVTLTLREIVERMKKGLWDFDFTYPQRNFVWTSVQTDALAYSLLNGFPLGAFVILPDGKKWMVWDGKQRSSTIRDMLIEGKLPLGDKFFHELPQAQQDSILDSTHAIYKIDSSLNRHEQAEVFIKIQNAVPTTLGERLHALDGPVCEQCEKLIAKYSDVFSRIGHISLNRHSALELTVRLLFMEHSDDHINPNPSEMIPFIRQNETHLAEALANLDVIFARIQTALLSVRSRKIDRNFFFALYWLVREADIKGQMDLPQLSTFVDHVAEQLREKGSPLRMNWRSTKDRTATRYMQMRYQLLHSEWVSATRARKKKR